MRRYLTTILILVLAMAARAGASENPRERPSMLIGERTIAGQPMPLNLFFQGSMLVATSEGTKGGRR